MTAPEVIPYPPPPDVLACSPGWWVANAARVLAGNPPRLVKLTHYPDDPVWDDSPCEVDPATGYYTFEPWPGVSFMVPPDSPGRAGRPSRVTDADRHARPGRHDATRSGHHLWRKQVAFGAKKLLAS